MADVRINALAVTATTTVSDDFIALDGAANGTRKMSAYTPSFTGGLTNTPIGATTPSTGAFTTLSSNSTTTLNGTTIPASKTLVVTTDKLSALSATTSAELAGVISDETGSGALVFANSPTLVTPALGTPSSGTVTNLTGTASININGTVGATTPAAGAFTTLSASGVINASTSGVQSLDGVSWAETAFNDGRGSFLTQSATKNGGLNVISTSGLPSQGQFTASVARGSLTALTAAVSLDGLVLSMRTYGGSTWANTARISLRAADTHSETSRPTFIELGTTAVDSVTVTERMRIDSSGNVLIGTSTNSANGILQLTSHTTSAGGIGFGTDVTLYRSAANVLKTDDDLVVAGALSSTGALAIGNTVNTVSPTSPNRTVTIVIGGTTYYLHAKTTND